MNAVISSKRIETIREILLASGWHDEGGGYLAPDHMRADVAAQYGDGRLHLWDAVNCQTRFDCFVVATLCAA